MAMDEKWQDEVFEKLVDVFKSNEEDLARILFFLDEEDKSYKDNVARPYAPHWKRLKDTVGLDKAFRMYAKRLSDETRTAEKDQEYRKRLAQLYEETLSYDESAVPIEENQKLDSSQLLRRDSTSTSAFGGLARAWEIIPAQVKESLANYIKTTMRNRTMMTAVDDVVGQISNTSGTVVMVGLAAVYLTVTAYNNIKRWWSGEITGKRCIKNFLDSSISVGAGMVGGCYGALAGSFIAGPAGTFAGSVVGGWVSAASASYLSDWMTQKIFGLPKEEALENAYRYLGVDMTASNAEVNTAFRKLCLQHHPDKGGNADDFFILQCNMGIIRLARGEP